MQEMQGIVQGANAAGARAHGRALDVLDIIVLNTSNEIDTLHDALLVTPNAPHLRIATQQPLDPILSGAHKRKRRPQRCNAFIAHGPAFRPGTRLPVFDNVDVYPLLMKLLHVKPAPNDGDVHVFDAVLTGR